MNAQEQNPGEELYVHRIDELREEVRHAMAAISGNRLQAFEESLWRQEVLCTGLKHLLLTAQAITPSTTSGIPVNTRLQASLEALHQVNRSYAELIRQARSSNHLLYALSQNCAAPAREMTDPTMQRYSLKA